MAVTGARDDHPIDYQSDAIWQAHVTSMIEGARALSTEPVDAVFTPRATARS